MAIGLPALFPDETANERIIKWLFQVSLFTAFVVAMLLNAFPEIKVMPVIGPNMEKVFWLSATTALIIELWALTDICRYIFSEVG